MAYVIKYKFLLFIKTDIFHGKMNMWKKRNELTNYIRSLLDAIQKNIPLNQDIKFGIQSAISYINSVGGIDLIMFLSMIIYLLRNRISNKDMEYFKSDEFQRTMDRLMSHATFMDTDMKNGITSAFAKIQNPISFGSTVLKPITTMQINNYVKSIIDIYPVVVKEYIDNAEDPPFIDI